MPSATMKPNIEIMFMLIPAIGMKMKLPMNEMVMPIMTQKASLNSRNSARITMTIKTAWIALSVSSDSRSR